MQVASRQPLCPVEGYHEMEATSCSTSFIKCRRNARSLMEGYVYQCPQGFAYWQVSRRCERTSKLLHCRGYDIFNTRWEIPIEMENISLRRRKSATLE